ncbi:MULTISPECIES: hypothetical protein [Roseobacteraceae]|uniref:hypothetical protein n=1 Tax=Roseobacteraceae TaxID=2854170 RepID=UPI003B8B5400
MHVLTVEGVLLFVSAVATTMSFGVMLMPGRKIPVKKEVEISEIVASAPYHRLEPEIIVEGPNE